MAYFSGTVDGVTATPACVGMPVDVFPTSGAIGEQAFAGREVFTAPPYAAHRGDPRAQAEACQEMMRTVIRHAHARAMRTCFGFELMETDVGAAELTDKPDGGLNLMNPLSDRNLDISRQRLESLVNTYPESDYYWLWQSEGRGYLSRPVGREPGAAEMREAKAHWCGRPNLEGDIDYAYLFRRVVESLPQPLRKRVATGGWTIEHLFPNIAPEFSADTILASLNSYDPRYAVEAQIDCFRSAADGRRNWMIDWWEFDGEQWFPQFRATWQERMYDRCREFGVEAVTLLGWKLSGVEHNVRYLADYCWRPGLTAEDFYREYAKRLYGDRSGAVADLLLAYDRGAADTPPANPFDDRSMLLGAGWMALGVPGVPGAVAGLEAEAWKRTVRRAPEIARAQAELLAQDEAAVAVFDSLAPDLPAAGAEWLALMRNRLAFRGLYLRSMMALNRVYPAFDEAVRAGKGLREAADAVLPDVKTAVDLARKAIELYAEDVRNTGDLGVIAQLNEQYYKPLHSLLVTLGGEQSPYLLINPTAYRLVSWKEFAADSSLAWAQRDGRTSIEVGTDDNGAPVVEVGLGGEGVRFNSIHIHPGPIPLEQAPVLDFEIRVLHAEPFAFLFQVPDNANWYALNLVGQQSLYTGVDSLPLASLEDGEWYRVTWDLGRAVRERIAPDVDRIESLILGAWEQPADPIRVQFRNVRLGRRRTLD
jgi:hypothetical protein